MSLLDNGPHEVTVYPAVLGDDGYGTLTWLPDMSAGVKVRGRVQPGASGEDHRTGQRSTATVIFSGRTWPDTDPVSGAYARVAYKGREYDVSGAPHVYSGSPRTAHVTVVLVER